MSTGIPSYDELRVRIEPGAEGSYRVLAAGADGSTASSSFVAPFSRLELDNFILRVGLPRRTVRSAHSTQMQEVKRFGAALFDALVRDDVRDAYHAARRAAEEHDRGLRVTLQLTNVPELMEIPWEFLYERPRFLSKSVYTPIVRSLDLKTGRPPRKVSLPLRILGVVSSPNGVATLDVVDERRRLEQALAELIEEGCVELLWLDRATMSELDRVVGAPDELHAIHYIGHGAYDARSGGGMLLLEDARGETQEVSGEELASVLHDERSLGLAVLNACEGARTSHIDPFSGVATSLVECGIPAVIGMQFAVTDAAAIAFAARLYSSLAHGFPVDAALAQARRAIATEGNDIEFGTPVLFLRSGATKLFEISSLGNRPEPNPLPQPAPPVPEAEHLPDTSHGAPGDLDRLPDRQPPEADGRSDEAARIAAELNGFERLYTRKALARLADILEPSEHAQAVGTGSYQSLFGTDGIVVLTDRRLLFVTKRDDRDALIKLGDIASFKAADAGMGLMRLTIIHGDEATIIVGMDSDRCAHIVDTLHNNLG